MDIETSDNCNEDYLEVRENSISGKLIGLSRYPIGRYASLNWSFSRIGVYCGNTVPSDLPQAERYWLKFKSNSDGVGKGFLAEYTYGKSVH